MAQQTKECPSCAMEVPETNKICPICSYEFPQQKAIYPWVAILLAIVFLLMIIL